MAADLCGKCLPALRWAAKARAAGSNPVFRSEGLLGHEPFFVSIDASSVLLTADTSEAHVQREPLCWQARGFLLEDVAGTSTIRITGFGNLPPEALGEVLPPALATRLQPNGVALARSRRDATGLPGRK